MTDGGARLAQRGGRGGSARGHLRGDVRRDDDHLRGDEDRDPRPRGVHDARRLLRVRAFSARAPRPAGRGISGLPGVLRDWPARLLAVRSMAAGLEPADTGLPAVDVWNLARAPEFGVPGLGQRGSLDLHAADLLDHPDWPDHRLDAAAGGLRGRTRLVGRLRVGVAPNLVRPLGAGADSKSLCGSVGRGRHPPDGQPDFWAGNRFCRNGRRAVGESLLFQPGLRPALLDSLLRDHRSRRAGVGFWSGLGRAGARAGGNDRHSLRSGRVPARDLVRLAGAGASGAARRPGPAVCEKISVGMSVVSAIVGGLGRQGWIRAAIPLALVAALAATPWIGVQPNLLRLLFITFIWTTTGIAWNILGGFTGQVSFGFAVFYGLGAYAAAILINHGFHPYLAFVGSALMAVFASLIVGVPTFRLRGPYFAIATIGVSETVRVIMTNLSVTGGASGYRIVEKTAFRQADHFYSALLLVSLAFIVSVLISRSKFGLALTAIRDDEPAASDVGINPLTHKLAAHGVAAALAGVAGGGGERRPRRRFSPRGGFFFILTLFFFPSVVLVWSGP